MAKLFSQLSSSPPPPPLPSLLNNDRSLSSLFTRHELILIRQKRASQHTHLFACRFQVFYTVSQPSPQWDGYEGRVSMEMLLEVLPPPPSAGHEGELLIAVCGPDPFTQHIVR